MSETLGEKVIRLETQMVDNKAQLNRVESKVDTLVVSVNNLASIQIDVNDIRKEINDLKSHRFRTGWLYPTLSATAALVFGYLVLNALHLTK